MYVCVCIYTYVYMLKTSMLNTSILFIANLNVSSNSDVVTRIILF